MLYVVQPMLNVTNTRMVTWTLWAYACIIYPRWAFDDFDT